MSCAAFAGRSLNKDAGAGLLIYPNKLCNIASLRSVTRKKCGVDFDHFLDQGIEPS